MGVPPSHETSEFYDRSLDVDGRLDKVRYLVQGLRWAVRKFDAALPELDAEGRSAFEKMRASHLKSIAELERLTAAAMK